MITRYLVLLFTLILILITQHSAKTVVEHESNDSLDPSLKTTIEKTLNRITRHRRQYIDTEEIWGMAKKVAITVFVIVPLCIICCIITTIYICVKCCCGGNNNRKRNQGFTTVPQPIIIHTGTPNYQPQFQQQQQPPPRPQNWNLENHPMLPQPSAPPQPIDDFRMDLPPPYEKISANR